MNSVAINSAQLPPAEIPNQISPSLPLSSGQVNLETATPLDPTSISKHEEIKSNPEEPGISTKANLQKLIGGVGMVATAANIIYVLCDKAFGPKSVITKRAKACAEFVTRGSMVSNAGFNVYFNGHQPRKFCTTLGYLGEGLLSALCPYNVLSFFRGFFFPIYQMPNLVTALDNSITRKTQYTNYLDNLRDTCTDIKEVAKQVFSKETYIGKDFLDSIKKIIMDKSELLTSFFGATTSFAGVLTYFATGDMKLGSIIKGIGEACIDVFQILPQQWLKQKKFYIFSGLSFILGTLSEMISKQLNNEPITMALCFVGSGIGRILMTLSNTNKEDEYPIGGPRARSSPRELAAKVYPEKNPALAA